MRAEPLPERQSPRVSKQKYTTGILHKEEIDGTMIVERRSPGMKVAVMNKTMKTLSYSWQYQSHDAICFIDDSEFCHDSCRNNG